MVHQEVEMPSERTHRLFEARMRDDRAGIAEGYQAPGRAVEKALKRAKYHEGDLDKTVASVAKALIESKPFMEYLWGLSQNKRSDSMVKALIERPVLKWLKGHDAEDDPEMRGIVADLLKSLMPSVKSDAERVRSHVRMAGMRESVSLSEGRFKDARQHKKKQGSLAQNFKAAYAALGSLAGALSTAGLQNVAQDVEGGKNDVRGHLRQVQKQVDEDDGEEASLSEDGDRMPSRMQSASVQIPLAFQVFHEKARRIGKKKSPPDAHGFSVVEMEAPGVLVIGDPARKKAKFKVTYMASMSRGGDIFADTVSEWKKVDGLSPVEKMLLKMVMRTSTLRWSVASAFFEGAE